MIGSHQSSEVQNGLNFLQEKQKMKVTKLAIALLAATGISAIATPAMAYEAGDWLVRGRIITVNPLDNSGLLDVPALGRGFWRWC